MIEFKPNKTKEGFNLNLDDMDEFQEFMQEKIKSSCDMIHFLTGVVKSIVEETGVEGLPECYLIPEAFFGILDSSVEDEESCIALTYAGENEEGEFAVIADIDFADDNGAEGTFSITIKIVKRTGAGVFHYDVDEKEWVKEAENIEELKKDDLVWMVEDFLHRDLDDEEREGFLGKNARLKELKEHPDTGNLVDYDILFNESMYEDDELDLEDLTICLIPKNVFCSGMFVSLDEATGDYLLCADVVAGEFVEMYEEAYGENADGYLDCIEDGSFVVFQTSNIQEMVKALKNMLDHYTDDEQFAIFPLSKNEYVRMQCTGENGVCFALNTNKKELSEQGQKNMQTLMRMLGVSMLPVKK